MTSTMLDNRTDPGLEVMMIQRQTISTYLNAIQEDFHDSSRECDGIRKMLDELEQLCRDHFEQQDQFLDGLNFPPATQQKSLHDIFLKNIVELKTNGNQCHSPAVISDFMKLRLEYIRNTNSETMLLCDFISSRSSGTGTPTQQQ